MWLNSIKKDDLKKNFPTDYFERGHDYYRRGQVEEINSTVLADQTQVIRAIVRGSERYSVSVELKRKNQQMAIYGRGSCPMEINCKHVIATLLKAIDSPLAQANLPVRDPNLENWLRQLNQPLITDEELLNKIDQSYSLHYILSIHKSTKLQVNLALVRRLKSGQLGAEKNFKKYNHRQHMKNCWRN